MEMPRSSIHVLSTLGTRQGSVLLGYGKRVENKVGSKIIFYGIGKEKNKKKLINSLSIHRLSPTFSRANHFLLFHVLSLRIQKIHRSFCLSQPLFGLSFFYFYFYKVFKYHFCPSLDSWTKFHVHTSYTSPPGEKYLLLNPPTR